MKDKQELTRVDISGASLELDGDLYYLESGELVVHTNHLYSAGDRIEPTESTSMIEITCESYQPEVDE